MTQITEITNQAKQNLRLGLADGTTVSFTLFFKDNQKGWYYSVSHEATGFAVNNRRLVMSPNMLRAFRRIIPFGLSCVTRDGQEPIFQDDFITARASFYLLDSADVLAAEAVLQ